MAENSKIEWCTHTFNIAWGCSKVSPGCANCYADTLSHRYGFDVWGPVLDRKGGDISEFPPDLRVREFPR